MVGTGVVVSGAQVRGLCSESRLQHRVKFALKNWGVDAVFTDTTQDALVSVRDGVARSNKKPFQLLLADLASIRTTAVALNRNIRRKIGRASCRERVCQYV